MSDTKMELLNFFSFKYKYYLFSQKVMSLKILLFLCMLSMTLNSYADDINTAGSNSPVVQADGNVNIIYTQNSNTKRYNTRTDTFSWLNSQMDADIFQEFEQTFSKELQPDKSDNGYIPHLYKYISGIGEYNGIYIVLISSNETKETPKEYGVIKAFSYNKEEQKITEIKSPDAFHNFKFDSLQSFEPSIVPDIVFSYQDCMECEPVNLLASFTFDQIEEEWKIRNWVDDKPYIIIGNDHQYGEEDGEDVIWEYDYIHAIADVNSDSFADIVIRSKEDATKLDTGSEKRPPINEAIVYTIQSGILGLSR